MNTRNLAILVVALLVILGGAGFYLYYHPATPAFSYTIIDTGDRQHKESSDYYTVQINYPDKTPLETRGSWGAEARAEATIVYTLKDLIDQFKDASNVDNLSQAEKDRIASSSLKYSLNVGYRAFSSGAYVSYEFEIYMDTGGVHPTNLYKTLVFDLNGDTVKLGDLFASSAYLDRLSSAGREQITAQLEQKAGTGAGESLLADGIAPRESNFENFVVDSDRIRVFIPPYQAAAYAAGSFEIQIPLADVKDILKPDVH
jgi:hypothetical protein